MPLLFIVGLSIVLRIPRVPHLEGLDGFVLMINSYSLINGFAQAWLIHPLSYLGMFSFSGYPIGSVSILSFFLLIGGTSEAGVMLYLATFSAVSVYAMASLMRYLFKDKRIQYVGIIFYIFMPTIYDFTYNMATSRAPFMAIAPFFIKRILEWSDGKGHRYLVEALLINLLMVLFHRSAIALLTSVVLAVLFGFIRRILIKAHWSGGESRLLNKFLCLTYVTAIVGLFIFSVFYYGLSPKTVLPDELLPTLTIPIVRDFIGLALDYMFYLGPMVFLTLIGIYYLLKGIWTAQSLLFEDWHRWALLLLFLVPFIPFIASPAYTRHLFAPLITCYSTYALSSMITARKRVLIQAFALMAIPYIVYFQLYNIFWKNIEPYATGSSLFIFALVFAWLIVDPLWRLINARGGYSFGFRSRLALPDTAIAHLKTVNAFFIILLVLTITITNSDMKTTVDMDGRELPKHVSDEEISIANYIRLQHESYSDRSILLSSHYLIELRIGAYAQSNTLSEGLGTALLEVGYVSTNDALQNSTMGSLLDLNEPHIFGYPLSGKDLWFEIMYGNFSDPRIRSLLEALHIRYFVALKAGNEAQFKVRGTFESLFRATLTAPIVYETNQYLVYKLD